MAITFTSGFSIVPTQAGPQVDLIRAALSNAYTQSYDNAVVGSFIQVDAANYLSISSSISATTFGMDNTTMNGPNGIGLSWGAPFAFTFRTVGSSSFTNDRIPASNYVVGFSTIFNSTGQQTASIFYSTGSVATSSIANKIGTSVALNVAAVTTSGSRHYFIRKAPTDALPDNSWMYLWSKGSLKVRGPIVNPLHYKSLATDNNEISGSWLTWTNAGYPAHQFIATTNKQW
jgi:hypothetical protein